MEFFNTFFYPELQSKHVCPLATNMTLKEAYKKSDDMDYIVRKNGKDNYIIIKHKNVSELVD